MEVRIREKDITDFKEHLKKEEKSPATIEKYVRDAGAFRAFVRKQKISKELVIEYKERLKESYAPASVNSMLAAVNTFLSFLGHEGFRVKQLKVQKKVFCNEGKELSKEEYLRLIKAANSKGGERISLIAQTICATGIRVSELAYITAEAVHTGQAVVSLKGKIRIVFIPPELKTLLIQYIKKQGIICGAVFITKNGKPVNRSNVWREMKALCESAGVSPSKVFPHSLRHLFARTFFGLEKDIVKLADILGHSSVETTRIYLIDTGAQHAKMIGRLGLVVQ